MNALKKTLVLSTAFVFVSIIAINTTPSTVANGSGAPASRTGSPSDGANCTFCHSTTASTLAGIITSNIPASGYVPGTTYTVTASIAATGINKFGFEISPQTTAGVKKGTLVITDAAQTQLLSAGKYITHKAAGTAGTGAKTWTFDWIAPAAGSGNFTFYGAFVLANGNNANSGDQVRLSTLAVTEALATGVEEELTADNISIYPNPATDQITINAIAGMQQADVTVTDLSGRTVRTINGASFDQNQIIDLAGLPKGMYVLRISSEKGNVTKKFVKE